MMGDAVEKLPAMPPGWEYEGAARLDPGRCDLGGFDLCGLVALGEVGWSLPTIGGQAQEPAEPQPALVPPRPVLWGLP
jgi:hypothetical protein